MDMVKIGLFIKQMRKEKGLTQEELAEKLGTTSKSISRWENGQNMPDYSLIKSLAEILGVSVNDIINGEQIKKEDVISKYDDNIVKVLEEYNRMKKREKRMITIGSIALGIFGIIKLAIGYGALLFLVIAPFFAKVEVHTDIENYNNYIGKYASETYQIKFEMDEEIFPKFITDEMEIEDFKMVYYNPWDAQYLSYLVVDYSDDDYQKEVERLENIPMTDYIGYYDVSGFTKYRLLAMFADSYNGFVYALTDDENRIIYVELIFCNYFYDLEYEEYIPDDYLPDGFNAHLDNPYSKRQLK